MLCAFGAGRCTSIAAPIPLERLASQRVTTCATTVVEAEDAPSFEEPQRLSLLSPMWRPKLRMSTQKKLRSTSRWVVSIYDRGHYA